MINKNRKTTIPQKEIPPIVEWLLANCTPDEKEFMAAIASDPKRFTTLRAIISHLTDYNVYQVFYGDMQDAQELAVIRAAKRGEVAGLKAFQRTCELAWKQARKKEGGE